MPLKEYYVTIAVNEFEQQIYDAPNRTNLIVLKASTENKTPHKIRTAIHKSSGPLNVYVDVVDTLPKKASQDIDTATTATQTEGVICSCSCHVCEAEAEAFQLMVQGRW